jgi:hypothetical protein
MYINDITHGVVWKGHLSAVCLVFALFERLADNYPAHQENLRSGASIEIC